MTSETTRPHYRYQAVSGASIWGGLTGLKKARQRVCALRVTRADAEVERVLQLPGGGRRYWRWRNGRWDWSKLYDDPSPKDLAKWDYAPSIARELQHAA